MSVLVLKHFMSPALRFLVFETPLPSCGCMCNFYIELGEKKLFWFLDLVSFFFTRLADQHYKQRPVIVSVKMKIVLPCRWTGVLANIIGKYGISKIRSLDARRTFR